MNWMISRDSVRYAGFGLTSVLSAILSVLLLTSVANSWSTVLILAAMAMVLELGKWYALYDRRSVIAAALVSVSVLGSAGGLGRSVSIDAGQYDHIVQQRNMVLAEIEQNNQAIRTYLSLDRIKNHAQPLQQRNAELREQLSGLPQPEVSQLASGLHLLASFTGVPLSWVTAAVVLLLATLVDVLGWLFLPVNLPEPKQEALGGSQETSRNVETLAISYPAFRKMQLARREAGEPVLSQRACIRQGYGDKPVRRYFQRLAVEGVIEKQGGAFRWCEGRQLRFVQ